MPDFDWILECAIEVAEARLGPPWPLVRSEASKLIGQLVECAEYIDDHSSFMPDEQARSMFNIHQQAVLDAMLAGATVDASVAAAAVAAVVQVIKSNVPLPVAIFEAP